MKRLLLILLLIPFACDDDKEDSTYCFECVTTQRTTGGGLDDKVDVRTTHCDLTQDQADQLEKSGSSTATATSGGITVNVKTTIVCGRK